MSPEPSAFSDATKVLSPADAAPVGLPFVAAAEALGRLPLLILAT